MHLLRFGNGLCLAIALLVALLGAPSPGVAENLRAGVPDSIVVSFDPLLGALEDTLGVDTLCVSVTIDAAATDVRGFSLVFEYDPSTVQLASAQAGSLLTGAPCPHFFTVLAAAGDSVWIDAAALGCSVAGPGEIVELCFVGIHCSADPRPLRCRVDPDTLGGPGRVIRNGANESIPYSVVDGAIIVDCPISVEVGSWGRTKGRYRLR
jgi:hypothetical protein